MIIGSSVISMDSSRKFASETEKVKLSFSRNTDGNTDSKSVSVQTMSEKRKENYSEFKDIINSDLSEDALDSFEQSLIGMRPGNSGIVKSPIKSHHNNEKHVREQTLMYLIRFLYNKLWRRQDETFDLKGLVNYPDVNTNSSSTDLLGYTYESYSYSEKEETSFSTTGKVVTKDGKEIEFNVDVLMSRSFSEKYLSEKEIRATAPTNLVDPLVINLDGNVTNVSDQKFYFDLDSDGVLDSISSLDSGSGFVALDLNEDGVINDGSELFGTSSGNGFLDLSKYDEDGNGWIDEADSVFSKLLIWTKDENGNDLLYHLKDKGVGALCLESVNTEFSHNSLQDNVTNAVLRKTGLFLYENGQVGTMGQRDLAT